MKLLNLDELVPNDRFVTIKGVEYPVVEQPLGDMIKAIKKEEQAKKEGNSVVSLESLLDAASRLIPSAPADVIASLSIRQLMAVVAFASDSGGEQISAQPGEADPEGK